MKKALTLTLALLLVVSSVCFAETDTIEEVPMDVAILAEEADVEPHAFCKHNNTDVREEEDWDCIYYLVQDVEYCEDCGMTLRIGKTRRVYHGDHLGPFYWSFEVHDGQEVRVRMCRHCSSEVDE